MNIPAFTDSNTGKKSYTLSALVIGFAVINFKLLFSGIQLTDHIKLDSFSGIDYGASISGLGVIYNWAKNSSNKTTDGDTK